MNDLPEKICVGSFESRLYSLIKENWPITSIELAELLSENLDSRIAKKRAYSKYSYYLKKMISNKLLISKKSGKTLVVWPVEVEKYRVIDSIISGKPLEKNYAKQLL